MKTNDMIRRVEFKLGDGASEGLIVPEFKAAKGGVIEGYASLYDVEDKGGDIVQPGAFAASLARKPKVKMLWQHDPSQVIGVWDEVREDAKGLYVRGRLLEDVEKGREASVLVKEGAIDGLSIGYRTIRATKNDQGRRILMELDIWEVSLVTFPMLSDATIDAKAASAMSQREFERQLLRDSKLSRTVVAALMRDGFKGVQALSDSGDEDYSELLEAVQAASLISLM